MLSLLSLIRKPWLLVVIGIAGAFAAGFWRGHEAGSDAARVSQLRAEIEAERDRARRLASIRDQQDRRIADLEDALRNIDDEPPLTGDGADCPVGPGLLCQLRAEYDPNHRCDPTISSSN